jgi:hypothetical protein
MNIDRVRADQRDFKGVFLPKDIWCNKELDGDEKLMWGEVFALDNNFGCIAGNEHFQEMFGWNNDRKVQRLIKSLKDKDYITVEIDKTRDHRVIRIVGKYRHLDREAMSSLEEMRAQLLRDMRM